MKKKAFFTMLAVVLVLVLSLTVFVACNKDKENNTGETPATYSVTVNGGTGGGEYTAGATVYGRRRVYRRSNRQNHGKRA